MGFTSFLSDHPLLTAFAAILFFLIWRFGIQPRLGMTNNEIANKIEETMDGVAESFDVASEDLIDQSTMPFSEKEVQPQI